jgi:hypothetical protein
MSERRLMAGRVASGKAGSGRDEAAPAFDVIDLVPHPPVLLPPYNVRKNRDKAPSRQSTWDSTRAASEGAPLASLVRLTAFTVQPFANVVHELVTNAAKHGALSGPEGRVDVAWEASANGGLHVSWQESGGPGVPGPPGTSGFGDRPIRRPVTKQLAGSTLRPCGELAPVPTPARHPGPRPDVHSH